ncbi:MAG: hypothetical protein GY749_07595 [Desulfobacteraceae bacterium]|nr:hypothetical protein [Desulfobacteraceae bacterium]
MAKFAKLGIEVKDKITGLIGVTTGKANYITGCDQYLVQPQGDGKKYPDASWIDEGRLVATDKGTVIEIKEVLADDNGCDIPAPIK